MNFIYGLFLMVAVQASNVYAGDAPAPGLGVMQFMPIILIFVIFYFLMFRPQQKRMKQQREMLSNLRKGDMVMTSSGMVAKVHEVGDNNFIHLEIAAGVVVKLTRPSVTALANVEAGTLAPRVPAATDDNSKISEKAKEGAKKLATSKAAKSSKTTKANNASSGKTTRSQKK